MSLGCRHRVSPHSDPLSLCLSVPLCVFLISVPQSLFVPLSLSLCPCLALALKNAFSTQTTHMHFYLR